MRWLRPVDGLRVLVGLIVLVHLIVVGLTITIISSKQNQPDAELFRLVPAEDARAIALAVEATPPAAREAVLRGLSVNTTLVMLGDGLPRGDNTHPDLREANAAYRAALQGRPFHVDFPPDARLTDLGRGRQYSASPIRLRVRLNDGTVLIIERTTPPAIAGFVMSLNAILIGVSAASVLVVVLIAGLTTRPLSRLARALQNDEASLSAPDLPVTGAHEIQQLSIAFNDMRRRLRDLVEERTGFLAAVAHDYRTYLTRLELRADYIGDPRQRALAMADLGEMSALLDDTLTFARVSATPPRPVHETTDIAAMIGSVLEARALQGEDVTATSPPPTGLAVRIDPLAMQRILANLVDNAVRYGGQARLSVRERQGRIEIRVDDDGPGVPEADLKDLTRPFHRLDHSRARHTGGAGLGLAIVDALAQQNGGTLTLGNRDGGGFSASVDLPAA